MVPSAARSLSKKPPIGSSGKAGTITCSPDLMVSPSSLRKSPWRSACSTSWATERRIRDLSSTFPPLHVRFPFDNQQFLCRVIPAAHVAHVADRQQDCPPVFDLLSVLRVQVQVYFLVAGIDLGDIMPQALILD